MIQVASSYRQAHSDGKEEYDGIDCEGRKNA